MNAIPDKTPEMPIVPSTAQATLLMFVPVATLIIGYLTEQSSFQFFPFAVVVIALIYVLFSMARNSASRVLEIKSPITQFAIAFLGGFTWIGQIGCIGVLLFWFI